MVTIKSQYVVPKTTREACSALLKDKGKGKIIAGGTDLLVNMKHGKVLPGHIINIAGVTGLDTITYDEKDGLRIGALATINSIETLPLIKEKFSVLAQAASKLGAWQVRNQATIGGNLCNASPSAELSPALLALGAKVKLNGGDGERVISIEDFFTGPGRTVVKPDEILTEVHVPNLPPRSGSTYLRLTRRKALEVALVGVAVVTSVDGDNLTNVRIALGAVSPVPIRAKQAEKMLRGTKMSDELLHKAGKAAAGESNPITDIRGSAEYRRKMTEVLVVRAIEQAVEQVKAK